MSSIEPDDGRGEVDCCQEIDGAFVVACSDGAELLEPGEEVLDEVAGLVEFRVVRARVLAVGFGWDDDTLAGLLKRQDHSFVGVEAFIADQNVSLDLRQEDIRAIEIAGLTGRQSEAGGIAQGVDGRIDLGAQPSS